MNLSDLKAPFDPARVSWRVGSTNADKTRGLALAYLDSRDVQDRLDAVCGAHLWQCRYMLLGATTVCEIGIKCGEEWVWKADGAGSTDIEAEKGALSDAFKRAAVKWGVGRYLYDLDSPWVALEAMGRSFKIAESEKPRLQALLAGKRELATERKDREKKTDVKDWALTQEERIFQIETLKELDAWELKCRAAMERLKGIDINTYDWLMSKWELRCEQLKEKKAS